MAYCTVDEVLERMGHSGATTEPFLSRISDAIDAATIQIDSDTGRGDHQSRPLRCAIEQHTERLDRLA
jgi:hypothetical protein